MVCKKLQIWASATAFALSGTLAGLAQAEQHEGEDRAREKAEEIGEEAKEGAEEARERAEEEAERLGEETREMAEAMIEEDAEPKQFLSTLRQENVALMQVAQSATDKAQNDRVQRHAQAIIDYARETNQRIEEHASRLDVELEETEPEIVSDDLRMSVQLAEGEEFDAVFTDAMIYASQSALQRLEAIQPEIDDPELQQFVAELRSDIRDLQTEGRDLQREFAEEEVEQEVPQPTEEPLEPEREGQEAPY